MTKPQLILLRGISGSGKSTRAKEMQRLLSEDTIVVSRDDLRLSLYNTDFGPPINEGFISDVEHGIIEHAYVRGITVISDNTNLLPNYLKVFFDIARSYGITPVLREIEVPLALAKANNQRRANAGGRFVPEHVIDRQHELFYLHQEEVQAMFEK